MFSIIYCDDVMIPFKYERYRGFAFLLGGYVWAVCECVCVCVCECVRVCVHVCYSNDNRYTNCANYL